MNEFPRPAVSGVVPAPVPATADLGWPVPLSVHPHPHYPMAEPDHGAFLDLRTVCSPQALVMANKARPPASPSVCHARTVDL